MLVSKLTASIIESTAKRARHRRGAAFTEEDAIVRSLQRIILRRAYMSLLKFSALSASRRCVFAVKSSLLFQTEFLYNTTRKMDAMGVS